MKRFFTFIAVFFLTANLFGQVTVIFNIDMNGAQIKDASGNDLRAFDASSDLVYVSGNIFGWTEPGTDVQYKLTDGDGDLVYTYLASDVAAGEVQYKFFAEAPGSVTWNCGEWAGGDNRVVTVGTSNVTVTDIFGDIDAHTVGVKDVENVSLNISPNPSTGLFSLSTKVDFEVINIAGKIVLKGNSNSINLTGFSSGMYFAKISTIEGTIIKKLIIK